MKRKRSFKKWPLLLALFIILLSSPAYLPGRSFRQGEGGGWQVYAGEPVVRLHVRASGDSPAEQRFKMAVASQVQRLLSAMRPPEADSCGAYLQFLQDCLPQLERFLREFAVAAAEEAQIEVQLAEESFPLRAYGRHVYPAGKYTALIVTIGEGAGENWWCLLFPSLCLPPVMPDHEPAEEEQTFPEEKEERLLSAGADGAPQFAIRPWAAGRKQPAPFSRWRIKLWEFIRPPGRHLIEKAERIFYN